MRLAETLAIVTALIAVVPTTASGAPLRELCPDRPGKDTPPCIVDKGHVMLEFGPVRYSREEDRSQYEFGETLARFGLTDTVELQMNFSPYNVVRLKEPAVGQRRTLRGAGDLTAAIKANFLNPEGDGTSVALQAFATAPTGNNGIGAGAWEGGIILPVSFELSDKLGLTLDPELDLRADEDGHGRHIALAGVASVSRDLGRGFEGSAEVWSMVHQEPGNRRTEASFDLALTWSPEEKNNLQFDVEVDIGLTKNTPKSEITTGVAYRF